MPGINAYDFRNYVVRPALTEASLWSQSAENLLMGIAFVETDLQYLKQVGNILSGGLGVYQMQKFTHDDLVSYINSHSDKAAAILRVSNVHVFDADSLVYNLRYATLMTRMFFARMPEPLPDAHDFIGMATLHKTAYNTSAGKTELDKSIPIFKGVCTP